MKAIVLILSFFVILPASLYSQSDTVLYFSQDDLMKVKFGGGTSYFFITDSTVAGVLSVISNSNYKFNFSLVKYSKIDSVFRIVGTLKEISNGKEKYIPFFSVIIGTVGESTNSKSINFGIRKKIKIVRNSYFDITFKYNMTDKIFFDIGYNSDNVGELKLMMEYFNLNELIK